MEEQINNTETTPTKIQDKNKLGLIPDGWTTPIISEVFQFINTTSFSRNQLNYDADTDLYYIHYGDIHSTYKKPLLDFEIETNVPKLNSDVVLPNSVQYLKDGDVIIADASEDYEGVGEAIEIKNLNDKVAISGLHTFALRDLNSKTVAGFRTYIFKNLNVKKALKTIATGSKVYGISKGNIQKFKIVLPTLLEQQKIANILSTWDKAISAQEKLIIEKQELKQELMRQLLNGKKRFPGYTKDWGIVPLNQITWFQEGPGLRKWQFTTEGIKVINITNLKHSGNLNLSLTNRHISLEEFNNKYQHFECDAEDIVMASSGNSYCKVSIVKQKDLPLIMNTSVIRFKPLKNCDYNFLLNLLKSEKFKREIDRMITGGAQPNFGPYHLNRIKVKIPCIEEQAIISSVLKSSDDDISKSITKLESLKSQKQGLMQQLLTGEKRVKI